MDVLASLAGRIGDVVSEMLLQQRVCGALPVSGTNPFEAKRTGGGGQSVRTRTAWTVAQSDFAGGSLYDDDQGSGDDRGDLVSMRSGYGASRSPAGAAAAQGPIPPTSGPLHCAVVVATLHGLSPPLCNFS